MLRLQTFACPFSRTCVLSVAMDISFKDFNGAGTLSELIFGSCVWLLSIFRDIFGQRVLWIWNFELIFGSRVELLSTFRDIFGQRFLWIWNFELIFGSFVWLLSTFRDVFGQRFLWIWNFELIFGSGNDWYIQQTLKIKIMFEKMACFVFLLS